MTKRLASKHKVDRRLKVNLMGRKKSLIQEFIPTTWQSIINKNPDYYAIRS